MKKIAVLYWACIVALMPILINIPTTMAQGSSESLIAFTAERDGFMDIYTMQPDGQGVKRLTEETSNNHNADWSPDGTQIAYAGLRNNQYNLYIMDADGRNLRLIESDDSNPKYDVSWSPDGTQIAYQSRPVIGEYGISILTIATGETRLLITMKDIQGLACRPMAHRLHSPVRLRISLIFTSLMLKRVS
jgi:Tol biopolymer transport system component